MTEPLDVAVQAALCAQLAAAPSMAPVSMPLVAYEPTQGTIYLDAHPVLRAEPQRVGIAFDSAHVYRGIFQVDVVAPDGRGEASALRIAALVVARFEVGTVLTAGGRKLEIQSKPKIAAVVTDAPWVRFPVSIPFVVIN